MAKMATISRMSLSRSLKKLTDRWGSFIIVTINGTWQRGDHLIPNNQNGLKNGWTKMSIQTACLKQILTWQRLFIRKTESLLNMVIPDWFFLGHTTLGLVRNIINAI